MILAEAAMSSAWNFAKSAGLPPPGTKPSANSFSARSAASALFTAAFRRLTMSGDVRAGAHRPYQLAHSKPGRVSAAVGTSGRLGRRFPEVTATTLS